LNIRLSHIQNPFTERVKQDIRREPRSEHHTSPGKKRICRLLVRLSQNNRSIGRKGNKQREKKDKEPQAQVIYGKFRTQKTANRG